MALVVFLQEDEDVPSVYRNLKIFCETAPRYKASFSINFIIKTCIHKFLQTKAKS